MKYRIGSIIEYIAFGGLKRTVKVTEKEADIKNGRPGFGGECTDASTVSVWGYDDQIVKVITY